MNTHHVDEKGARMAPASWRVGVPFPRGGIVLLPAERFSAGNWAKVGMDGLAVIDRGGKFAGIYTYGLTGCFCSALVRLRNGVVQRAVLNHYTAGPRWKDLVTQFNAAGAAGPAAGDTAYLVLAEAGSGQAANSVRDMIADAGVYVPNSHTYVYARSVGGHVSFGVSLERYGGELPPAALKNLPGVGWGP